MRHPAWLSPDHLRLLRKAGSAKTCRSFSRETVWRTTQGLCVRSHSTGSSCRHTWSVAWFHDERISKASSDKGSKPSMSAMSYGQKTPFYVTGPCLFAHGRSFGFDLGCNFLLLRGRCQCGVDDSLCFRQNAAQMIRPPKAFSIDFVNVFGAGWTRREPSAGSDSPSSRRWARHCQAPR